MYFVYILESLKSGEFYKGNTDNLNRRLSEHFAGKCKTTKNMLPLRLVHVEFCRDRLSARTMEKFFKSGFGREIIKEIVDSV